MPIRIFSISHAEAIRIVTAIVEKAGNDGGSAIAAAVVDSAGRLIAFLAMDGTMPASIKLAQSKAYSALIGKRDTVHWATTKKHPENIDFDMRNWTDDHFTCFTGGVVLTFKDEVIGGVGVSGRKGIKSNGDKLMQDNELAEYGKQVFETLPEKSALQ